MEHLAKVYYYEINFRHIISKYPNSAHKLFKSILRIVILCCNAVSQLVEPKDRKKKTKAD